VLVPRRASRYWMAASQDLTAQVHTIIYNPRGGDHAHPAASEACGRPTSHGSRPFLPRNVRLGSIRPVVRLAFLSARRAMLLLALPYLISTRVSQYPEVVWFWDVQAHSVFGPHACQFFPSPSTGEGEGGGEGRWSAQAVLRPPIPTFPRQGGRSRSPREAKGKSRTE